MKKSIILLTLAFLVAVCPGVVSAQNSSSESVTVLIVNMKDGGVNEYVLSDKPAVTFSDDKMNITSATLQDSYLKVDVSHFTFEQKADEAGVEEAVQEDVFSIRYIDNANVEVYSSKLTRVDVYNISGVKMVSVDAVDGQALVSVADLIPGVYVVVTNCHPAVKIIKR